MKTSNKIATFALAGASLLAGTSLAILATAAPASASSPKHPQRQEHIVLHFRENNGVELPTTVVANGPINDRGIESQSNEVELPDGMMGDLVLHLHRGDISGTFDEHHFTLDFDPVACTAVATSDGTMTFTNGTRRYADARGTLAFTVHADYVAQRDAAGACLGPDSGADPASIDVVVDAWGTLTS